ASLTQLARIDSEEELTRWLIAMLENIMDSIRQLSERTGANNVTDGMDFILENYAAPITRDHAAAAAHMSPSQFSRVLKEKTGKGFTDYLNQVRIDRATELIRKSGMSIMQIALEVGFNDQSYFTKVFRRHTNLTPRAYQKKHGTGLE
ncbi:MAG: helix-turn-helix transcriptional regulator, partial [Planctomycetes bacterium]|nr:helix-turn-helix transcriptional regulator [Planctomycetota bacterium]